VHATLSPDGTAISYTTFQGGTFTTRDLRDGTIIYELWGITSGLHWPVAISGDWQRIALLDSAGMTRTGSMGGGGPTQALPQCGEPKALSPDGSLILCFGTADDPSGVFEVESGSLVLDLGATTLTARGGGFNPDGMFEGGRFVTANDFTARAVRIYEVVTQELLAAVTLDGDVPFSAGAFDPSGRYLAGGSVDGAVWVLDLEKAVDGFEDPVIFLVVEAHNGSVAGHAISGSGVLATGAYGNPTIRLWDVGSLELRQEIDIQMDWAPIVLFSPDDQWLYYSDTAYRGYVIRRYPLDPQRLIELAKTLVGRDLTVDECRQFAAAPSCDSILSEEVSDG
jgi:WD40 repeat protein